MGGAHEHADKNFTDESPFPDVEPYNTPEEGFEVKYTGNCHCKAVKFEAKCDPVASVCCHCRTCQVVHGATSQRAVLFKKDMIKFDSDSLEHLAFYQTHDSKVGRHLPSKVRCKTCGTLVADEGRNMWLAFPALFNFGDDDHPAKEPESFKIQHHIFYGQRMPGMNIEKTEGVKFWEGKKEESKEL
ncbi:hypothetical protein JCM11251_000506 [Rhodosporidiobolus azoricus]